MAKEELILTEKEVTYLARYFDLSEEEINRLRRQGLTEGEMARIRAFLRRTDEQIADARRRGRTLADQLISHSRRFVWTEEDQIVISSPAEVAARFEAQDAVARDRALWLLAERAVLTRAVCRELQDSGGEFYGRRPFRALALLLEWVQSNFPQPVATAENGLDAMVVPEDCQDLLREIRDGAEICDALAMLTTADNALDEEGDKKAIARKLAAYWEAHAQIVKPPWR
jgi:hypothetical protein